MKCSYCCWDRSAAVFRTSSFIAIIFNSLITTSAPIDPNIFLFFSSFSGDAGDATESAGEDEEEAGQGSGLRGGSTGGTDTYIDIPKADGSLSTNLLEKPCIDKKVKVGRLFRFLVLIFFFLGIDVFWLNSSNGESWKILFKCDFGPYLFLLEI